MSVMRTGTGARAAGGTTAGAAAGAAGARAVLGLPVAGLAGETAGDGAPQASANAAPSATSAVRGVTPTNRRLRGMASSSGFAPGDGAVVAVGLVDVDG